MTFPQKKDKIKFIQIKGPVEEKLEIRFLCFFGRKSIPFDDFVIDVSDVHDELDVVVEVVHHDATQNVHAQIRARVAHVRRVIDRRTADIERHPVRIARREGALLAVQGVVDVQGH